MIFDFDGEFDFDEYRDELKDPKNIPIVGPYFSVAQGDFLPSYSEESFAAMATIGFTTYVLGMSTRLAAAAILSAPFTSQPALVVGSLVASGKAEAAFIGYVIDDDKLSNVDKAIVLGSYTNVPY